MLQSQIIIGNYYVVKSPPTTGGNGAMFQIFKNHGGEADSFPFTVTAARYKISAEEIFPLKEEKDIRLAAWFKELHPKIKNP